MYLYYAAIPPLIKEQRVNDENLAACDRHQGAIAAVSRQESLLLKNRRCKIVRGLFFLCFSDFWTLIFYNIEFISNNDFQYDAFCRKKECWLKIFTDETLDISACQFPNWNKNNQWLVVAPFIHLPTFFFPKTRILPTFQYQFRKRRIFASLFLRTNSHC